MVMLVLFGVRIRSGVDATPSNPPTSKLNIQAAPKNGEGAPKEGAPRFSVAPENGASNVLAAPKLSSSPIEGQRGG